MDGYPKHAAQVRDLIVDLLKSQADHGKAMDTGGGMDQADLWVWIDGKEYFVTVKESGNPANRRSE